MVDIRPLTTENRRGKKEEKTETTGPKYNGLPLLHRAAKIIALLSVNVTDQSQMEWNIQTVPPL